MADLSGKTALVTGAARGIGRAIALRLAEAGADVAVCDLETGWLEETAAGIRQAGRRVEVFACDVSRADQVEAGVNAVAKAWGRLDVLVNNAGITRDTFLARMSEADWDAVLNVNLKGAFLFTKAASRWMLKQRSGSIVNIASVIGIIGNAGQANYAASKGGLIAFTRTVARELASRNVRANAVAPGFIRTAMTDKLPEELRTRMLSAIPLARFGEPDDVARVVLFLASDDSAYVTGQVISVCGGMVMA
ncbi:MAG: 3-oxoacyl-[acyl-carrier-protein] reductase [Kiritimatiellae bacterium]|nr:3-oxoacyl-[acyl-carrier-protein] reductase [Kiritimatiellia bacterium]